MKNITLKHLEQKTPLGADPSLKDFSPEALNNRLDFENNPHKGTLASFY